MLESFLGLIVCSVGMCLLIPFGEAYRAEGLGPGTKTRGYLTAMLVLFTVGFLLFICWLIE